MTPAPLAAPFPYFGGKRRAAPIIWPRLGDPSNYIEPFAGSAAVLLARPTVRGRRIETINDADGWLVNTWRAIKLSPGEVASHAAGPVTEIDYHARLAWLQARRGDDLVQWLEGDPEAHDAKAAAWWLYVAACGIGTPWDSGPWHVVDGRLQKTGTTGQGIQRGLPNLADAGRGIHRAGPLDSYMQALATRLAQVRIACGDWRRVVQTSVINSGANPGGDGSHAILLDPPYATSSDLYHHGSATVAADVRAWCVTAPPGLRIALCGYLDEHDPLLAHGWTRAEGKSGRGGGYSGKAERRERIWFSPACHDTSQGAFFDRALVGQP